MVEFAFNIREMKVNIDLDSKSSFLKKDRHILQLKTSKLFQA